MQVEEQVRAIVAPLLEDLSVDLWDVVWSGSHLRILVDKTQNNQTQETQQLSGIDTETLSLVSRILSNELDKSDPLPSVYTLEVSSPGIEKTLRHPEHFQNSIGEVVVIKLSDPIENESRFSGVLTDVTETGIMLKTAQEEINILFSAIKKANCVFAWDKQKDN